MLSLKQELIALEKKGLRRFLRLVETESSHWIFLDSKRVLNLCSNNYLGLANDPRIKEAAIEAIRSYGFGSGASRLVTGNMKLHRELEDKICEFKETEGCLVFNSGYTANVGIISALVKKGDIVFCDKLNHASITDGIILSRAEFKRYPHRDINTLEVLLKKSVKFRRRLIVSDSVFSMDGDIAPLGDLINLAQKYNCLLMIDEAHATGVLGKKGKGVLEYLGLEDKKSDIIQMGTLSKAVGGFGAYVCGSKDLIDYLINFSRSFIYTTSLPVSVAAANIKAIEIIQNEPEIRLRLKNNIEFFKKALADLGFDINKDETPIIPLITKDPKLTMEFSKRLFEEGIFVQGIRPPAVPEGKSRLRISLMATHTRDDLSFALEKIKKIAKDLCLI
jgi:8-amino-7-oxononanoate synthase